MMSDARPPQVDVVVPVHTAERPVARTAASILDHTSAPARVTFVCHNVRPDDIRAALGTRAADTRVRLISLIDGIPSPAGPINAGLDAATAPFTSLLGSDDLYEPGAIDAWLEVQRRGRADVVIPRVSTHSGNTLRTPPTRPFRTHRLDGVRDRLSYRTVQLGLVSRERFAKVRMTPGLRSGEDVEYGLRIWFSDARISYAHRSPGYLITTDASDRVSTSRMRVAEAFAFLDAALDPEWTRGLDHRARRSIAIKMLRTHIMDAAAVLASDPGELAELGNAISKILAIAPEATEYLGVRDARIVEALRVPGADAGVVARELALRTDFRRASNLIPARPRRLLRRDAPLRFLAATALSR